MAANRSSCWFSPVLATIWWYWLAGQTEAWGGQGRSQPGLRNGQVTPSARPRLR
jgi:hypothetical protein